MRMEIGRITKVKDGEDERPEKGCRMKNEMENKTVKMKVDIVRIKLKDW